MDTLKYTDLPDNLKEDITEKGFNEAMVGFLSKKINLGDGEVIEITKRDLISVLNSRSSNKRAISNLSNRDSDDDLIVYC